MIYVKGTQDQEKDPPKAKREQFEQNLSIGLKA